VFGDDLRTFSAKAVCTDGRVFEKCATLPVVLDRGIWTDKAYDAGDGVSRGGASGLPSA
jgi:hypothetical protein